jgi:hypothetical protein
MVTMKTVFELIVGNEYFLRTCDLDGNFKNPDKWIRVIWDGRFLKDSGGCVWNEWLHPDYSDIFSA